MSNNPPLYTEFPLLYSKINVPEFVNTRILIITYHNIGYDVEYIAQKLSISPKYCSKIISIFHAYGFDALLKRDFGNRKKKTQKKFSDAEIGLLKDILRHVPPQSQNKWTYNVLTIIINNSGLFKNPVSLGALRAVMISQNINLDSWKYFPLKKDDTNFTVVSNLISIYKSFEIKSIKDFDLDIMVVNKIIADLQAEQKAITVVNVFLRYKQIFNLPKLSIYKFTKLLKYNLKNWDQIKKHSPKIDYYSDKKVLLLDKEKEYLCSIINNNSSTMTLKMRAKICLELGNGTNINKIEDTLGCSKSMIYNVYNRVKTQGINGIQIIRKERQKYKKEIYSYDFVKKYPDLDKAIIEITSKNPNNKSKWTILDITFELRSKNYNISTTTVAKFIKSKNISYR